MNILITEMNPIISLGAIGLFFGIALGFAAKKLSVKTDPKVEQLLEVLPSANCGACGEAGCAAFAESLIKGKTKPSDCIPGGSTVAKETAKILGIEAGEQGTPMIAAVQCDGSKNKAKERFVYHGIEDCKAATLVWGGNKACTYGCLGLSSCVKACRF
ncbi:RnfABCDGE type electron transport complex subunit B, partial [Candidatus Auribacterota bacterium]